MNGRRAGALVPLQLVGAGAIAIGIILAAFAPSRWHGVSIALVSFSVVLQLPIFFLGVRNWKHWIGKVAVLTSLIVWIWVGIVAAFYLLVQPL